MPSFRYRALDGAGHLRQGVQQADSARQARQLLRERGLLPRSCKAVSGDAEAGRLPRLRGGELAQLSRQLATLVQANLPLEEALAAVAEQSSRPVIRSVLSRVRAQVLEGQSLAAALGQFGTTFSELFRSSVAAGEQSGHLGQVLEQLADYTEARQESQRRIQMALVYPCVLLCASLAIVGFLLGYVVPDVVGMFVDSGRELPAVTRGLIVVSAAVGEHGLTVAILLAGLGFGLRLLLRRPGWRLRWHGSLLRVPLLGPMWRASEAARFASTLSIMGRSAVPLVQALAIAASVVGNLSIRGRLQTAAQSVYEGESLARSLAATGDIPVLMMHLIASGERAGELDRLLAHAARQQERILAERLALLVGLFEPLMLVLMGAVVMTIVLAILLPILSLDQLVT